MNPLRKANRIKKKAPKRGLFWCHHCDRQLTSESRKCPLCGKRNGSRRFKKA